MGHETGDGMIGQSYIYLKNGAFVLAHVCDCSFAVAGSLYIILGALERRAQRRSNAPKIMYKFTASSELCPLKDHHVESILKSALCMVYYRKSYCKKAPYF